MANIRTRFDLGKVIRGLAAKLRGDPQVTKEFEKRNERKMSFSDASAMAAGLIRARRRIWPAWWNPNNKRVAPIGTGGKSQERGYAVKRKHLMGSTQRKRALANERTESAAAIARAHKVKPTRKALRKRGRWSYKGDDSALSMGAIRYNAAMDKCIAATV